MFTNGTGNYPDIEAALARLEEEDPPAHVRAQRLAVLHVEMALASHGAVEDIRQCLGALHQHSETQFAALQKAQEAGTTKVQNTVHRSVQEIQREIETRLAQGERELALVRTAIARLGQSITLWRCVGTTLTGLMFVILTMVALWMALGQDMQVHIIQKPPGHPQSNGHPKGH